MNSIRGVPIPVQKLSDTAKLPLRASEGSAACDLYADEDVTIPSLDRRPIGTGIAMSIPEGFCGRIVSRSGLAIRDKVDVVAGLIDSDYRGEIKVCLANFGSDKFEVKRGDRIAQLLILKHWTPILIETETLTDTARGSGGFGSTGMK